MKHTGWVRNPIDAFVLARLEQSGIAPPSSADKRTLLRRVYLDVIGLPPSLEEQQRFLNDTSPNAYEKVVDDLLSRSQYGERWARHWLDVVRYADSNGYERDGTKPSAWRYRDYVIRALNADKPYDRFLTEQIAGDELPDSNAETQIATTFLRLGAWDDEPPDPEIDRYDQLDDVMGVTATAVLGITLRCARCHDHKFDPFSQKDYYRMLAVFAPLKRPGGNADRIVGTEAAIKTYQDGMAKADREVAEIERPLEPIRQPLREQLFKSGKSGLTEEVIAAFRAAPEKRNPHQQELVKQNAPALNPKLLAFASSADRPRLEEGARRIAVIDAGRPAEPPHAYIWMEEGQDAPQMHLLRRGDPKQIADEVAPGFPAVLLRTATLPPVATAHTTGRRLWLAHWLTAPENPLTARVFVNRVWQHHFGEGIVASANDFGAMGRPPTHPELLDWLATTFVEAPRSNPQVTGPKSAPANAAIPQASGDHRKSISGTAVPTPAVDYACGWSLKKLQRLILVSNTYRATSVAATDALQKDPDNRLLSRWRARRLEAEAIRDGMLAVAGQLNLEQGGPSIYPPLPETVLQGQSRPGDGWGKSDARQAARRSIYIFVKRSLAVPELEALDTPDTSSPCENRIVSTVAPQALTFMNGAFSREQAQYFAQRLRKEAGDAPAAQVQRAFTLAVCRPPTRAETQAALDFLAAQARQIEADAQTAGKMAPDASRKALDAFCLVLLNSNEFFYTD